MEIVECYQICTQVRAPHFKEQYRCVAGIFTSPMSYQGQNRNSVREQGSVGLTSIMTMTTRKLLSSLSCSKKEL